MGIKNILEKFDDKFNAGSFQTSANISIEIPVKWSTIFLIYAPSLNTFIYMEA